MLSVAAIIPTRGDVDLTPILRELQKHQSITEIRFVIGTTPFNRYKAMLESSATVFYTQDDDCVTDIEPLLRGYCPSLILNAMTPEHANQYRGAQTLIGFGAIFHRKLVEHAFNDFPWERDALFYRESDRIFPTVNPHMTCYPKIEILPSANAPNRLWKQPDHVASKVAINQRILEVAGIAA